MRTNAVPERDLAEILTPLPLGRPRRSPAARAPSNARLDSPKKKISEFRVKVFVAGQAVPGGSLVEILTPPLLVGFSDLISRF
jgi:hypothetical protein